MLKLEHKIELISDNEALIHRRILTPFFYVKLATFKAVFKEWKQPFIWLPTPWFPLYHKFPEGTYLFLGQWERIIKGEAKQIKLKELEQIHKSYDIVRKSGN